MIGMALMAVLMCVNFASCSEDDDDFSNGGSNIPKNTIRYQTTDGIRIRFKNEDVFGGTKIVKHTYSADDWWVIEFESDVTAIESEAFYEKENLLNIILPNSVKTIGNYAFFGCDALTSVTIHNSVTRIGEGAFNCCAGLKKVELNCEKIGSWFQGTGVEEVIIGNNVKTIGNDAFEYCSSLTSVTIGSGVTSIGSSAFKDCDGLTSIYVKASTPAKIEEYYGTCSLGCDNATLYVPKGSLAAYKAADGWNEFENIQEWDAK